MYKNLFGWAVGALLLLNGIVYPDTCLKQPIIYLTWQSSPQTTMTVQWLTDAVNKNDRIIYRPRGSDAAWQVVAGSHEPAPEGHDEILIHQAEITALKPDTSYEFFLLGAPQELYFRTMPETLDQPIHFVVGGDIYHDDIEAVRETSRAAAATNPSFALLGGDLAYAAAKYKDRPELHYRWLEFLRSWQADMVTSDGHMIPFLPTTSNEDTAGRYFQSPKEAAFFYALFATPGEQGYNVIDFGDYLSVWLLDSGHTHPINGAQADWLTETLAERADRPNKFAVYHVPAFPSYRDPNYGVAPLVREFWVPIFEEGNLDVAFEHHDHAYKRTHPIRNNQADPTGVLYIGDGGWGESNPRIPSLPEEKWYLAESASERHFIEVTIDGEETEIRAINYLGEVFDRTTLESRPE